MKQHNIKFIILIFQYLLIANGCIVDKKEADDKYCYDIEALKASFKHVENLSKISLAKELESNTKNLSEIKAILGEPIEEYIDIFKYGRLVKSRDDDLSIDYFYYEFPDTLWKIPRFIVHKCVWGMENKDITLFFANDCNNGEQPFWGYVTEYDDFYIPLRLLTEKNLTINEVIKKRGKPNSGEFVDTVHYGVNYPIFGDIYALRNVPEAAIHTYCWYIGGSHTLMLIYPENEDKDKAKPVWGMLCHNMYFNAE